MMERLALAQLSTSHWVPYPLAPSDLLVLEPELAMVWEAGQSTRFDRSAVRSRWTGTEFKQISHMSHFSYLHPSVVRQCCFIVASFNMLFSKPHVLPSKPRQAYEFCIWLGKNAWLPLDPPWPQHKGMLSYHLPWPFSLHSSAVQFLPASLALSSLWIWQSISKQNAITSSHHPGRCFSFLFLKVCDSVMAKFR